MVPALGYAVRFGNSKRIYSIGPQCRVNGKLWELVWHHTNDVIFGGSGGIYLIDPQYVSGG